MKSMRLSPRPERLCAPLLSVALLFVALLVGMFAAGAQTPLADGQVVKIDQAAGKITKGLDVLQKIAKAGSDPAGDGKPKKKVTIQDVTIAPV